MTWSVVFFFFKQKTADEMRISEWSSDVCSADLAAGQGEGGGAGAGSLSWRGAGAWAVLQRKAGRADAAVAGQYLQGIAERPGPAAAASRFPDRKSTRLNSSH